MGDISNRNNGIEHLIREALVVSEGECEVLEENGYYIIQPKEEKLQIDTINLIRSESGDRIHLFRLFNLNFKHCIFVDKIRLTKEADSIDSKILSCKFESCIFQNIVEFQATFSREILIHDSCFKMAVRFLNCIFEKESIFSLVQFDNYASFENAIFNDMVLFGGIQFYNGTFSGTIFHQSCYFLAVTFHNSIDFSNAIFQNEVNFASCYMKKMLLPESIDEQRLLFQKQRTNFYGNVDFSNAIFQNDISFHGSYFKERATFSKAEFHKKSIFSKIIFEHNAYFDEVKFLGEVDFNQSEFYKNTYLYKTKFREIPKENIQEKDIPNFLQTIFNGSINLTDTSLFIFDFKDLKSIIRNSHKANEFRNIFKNIKNALIKDNNLLDASRFHKMELYAKELELEYKKKEEPQNSGIRDFIDRIQLYCYRITSDHHTDLLLILNHIIFLIALFGLANLMLISFGEIQATISLLSAQINIIEIVPSLIFIAIAICFIFGCCKVFIFCISLTSYLAALIVSPLYCAPLFVFTLLCFLNLRQFVFILSYLVVAFMLFSNPSSILPILGKLIENKSTEVCLFVVGNVKLLCCGGASFAPETLNLIYMLFLFLLLWSLQKTARKNTIVPS